MDEAYSKEQALDLVHERRAALEARLAGVAPARMTVPGVVGTWSLKDVLAHIAWWERWMVRVLHGEPAAVGELAQMRSDDGQQVVDGLNAATYAARRDLPLAEVLAESRAAFEAAVAAIADLSDQAFARARRVVAANTFEHYEEHARGIENWLAGEGGS
jgi:uncharacterized protein (TIGR03083 family)